VGLRRLYDEVKAIEPPVEAWDRLRSRVTRPSTPSYGLRSPILGVVTAWALVAAIGVQAIVLPGVTQRDLGPVQVTSRDAFEPGVRYVSAGRILTTSTVPRQYPDRDGAISAALATPDRGRRVSNA
jgi:hypothetical protein